MSPQRRSRDRTARQPLPDDVLDAIEDLYGNGLFLQARALGERHRPLHLWGGLRGLLLARRLCAQLGGDRRAHALAALAWRQYPESLFARVAHARALASRAGAYAAWDAPGHPLRDLVGAYLSEGAEARAPA